MILKRSQETTVWRANSKLNSQGVARRELNNGPIPLCKEFFIQGVFSREVNGGIFDQHSPESASTETMDGSRGSFWVHMTARPGSRLSDNHPWEPTFKAVVDPQAGGHASGGILIGQIRAAEREL
jgi:hypothetical protein